MKHTLMGFIVLVAVLFSGGLPNCIATTPYAVLNVYLDADMSRSRASGQAILMGIETALAEVEHTVADMPVRVVVKDHRGSTARSHKNMKAYLADDKALAVFGGLHSPPYIPHRTFINESGIVLLLPWSAAAPLTRYDSPNNSIFRLSVDDSKAGEYISRHAVLTRKFKHPYLLLEDTGWGKSNERNMSQALRALNVAPRGLEWFQWNTRRNQARQILHRISQSEADCIFFVGNTPEGVAFSQAMSEMPKANRLPILSHWGILGGEFIREVTPEIRKKIDLSFIQTSFSFIGNKDVWAQGVLERAKARYPNIIQSAESLKAPTGFIHGYDLTLLLLKASKGVNWTGDIVKDRASLRLALENIQGQVRGLIKTYRSPFSRYTTDAPDAHEALGLDDLSMARFGTRGEIRLIQDSE